MKIALEESNGTQMMILDVDGVVSKIAKIEPVAGKRVQITLPDGDYWFDAAGENPRKSIDRAIKRHRETGKSFS